MIEDSEMAFKLEAMKREQEAKKEKLNENINQKMAKLKESANIAAEKIRLLNQELQILRLEFQIEETQLDAPREFTEKIDSAKSYCWGCCFCPTNEYIRQERVEVDTKHLKEFFHVKNIDDYEIKLEKLKERYSKLHAYGWDGCNKKAELFQNGGAFLGLLYLSFILPCCTLSLCCHFCCYQTAVGTKNCCYRRKSRTCSLLNVFSGFEKCGSFDKLSAKNNKKIETLTSSLAEIKKQRKVLISQNNNLLELLNTNLESLKMDFATEDVNEQNYYETVEARRTTVCCGCFTTELELQKIPCSGQDLSNFLNVKNEREYTNKLKELEKLDRKMSTCNMCCCVNCAQFTIGNAKKQSEDQQSGWCWLCGIPFIECFIIPCLFAYSGCQTCCDGIYRNRSRIHSIYETYKSYHIIDDQQ